MKNTLKQLLSSSFWSKLFWTSGAFQVLMIIGTPILAFAIFVMAYMYPIM